uniref:Uncharacterized protein n=1 Tax=Chloropicon laureae TaxID=464258 RepID=A0A7S2ZAB7_9CHLO
MPSPSTAAASGQKGLKGTPKTVVSYCVGTQLVSKYREDRTAANRVQVCLGLVSIPEYETEILVTLNTPLNINPKSSSAAYTEEEEEDDDEEGGGGGGGTGKVDSSLGKLSLRDNTNDAGAGAGAGAGDDEKKEGSQREEELFALFQAMLRSFRVVDYRLFGHG